jgi:predicted AlkP superfamily phosphohydrolase/phosphomutase
MKKTKQLLIGLDAMEWTLVERWASQGKLPTFRRLIDGGLRAILETTAAQLPDTVWSSIYSGANPAKYRKYFYVQYDAKTQDLRHVWDSEIGATPFWEYLSAANHRVGVVDVPKFPLSTSLDGFQIANWGAHATKTPRGSNPPFLLDDIDRRFGRHPVGDCDRVDAKPGALRDLRSRIIEGVRRHGELFRWLMKEQTWDVFLAAFSAPHCVGHHFWHWQDPDHPRHNEEAHGLEDSIEQVYRAVDREIGEMMALAGLETRAIVFAGHGMGPIYHASWNLSEILELLGYGRKPPSLVAGRSKARVNPWRVIKMVVPGGLQYAIKERLPAAWQEQLLFLWYGGGRKWQGSRAFAVPNNDSVGAIRIAVKGRDRYGAVEPGAEYERVCNDITAALYELVDPVSGRPVVELVTQTHRHFAGPHLDLLPDLTVLWKQSFAWNALRSPRFGTLEIPVQDGRTGSHTPRGFLLSAGTGAGAEIKGASTLDIAPTVLDIAGVPIPGHFDGRPLLARVGAA